MLYRRKIAALWCPEIDMATGSLTPARIMFRTAERLRSWKISPGWPAAVVAARHHFRSTVADTGENLGGGHGPLLSLSRHCEDVLDDDGHVPGPVPTRVIDTARAYVVERKAECRRNERLAAPALLRVSDDEPLCRRGQLRDSKDSLAEIQGGLSTALLEPDARESRQRLEGVRPRQPIGFSEAVAEVFEVPPDALPDHHVGAHTLVSKEGLVVQGLRTGRPQTHAGVLPIVLLTARSLG